MPPGSGVPGPGAPVRAPGRGRRRDDHAHGRGAGALRRGGPMSRTLKDQELTNFERWVLGHDLDADSTVLAEEALQVFPGKAKTILRGLVINQVAAEITAF